MLYAGKCYRPGVTETDLEQVTERAARAGLASGSTTVSYLGSLLFADDDLVLCLFHGPSRAAVKAPVPLRSRPVARIERITALCRAV